MTKDFHKKNLKNPFFKKREAKRYFSLIAIFLSFILVISATIYIIYYSPLFLIKNIQVNNAEINDYLATSYLNTNLIKVNKKELSRELLDQYQLNEIKIKKVFPNSLKVDIIEREAFFLLKLNDQFEFRDQEACKIPKQNRTNFDDFPLISLESINIENPDSCLDINSLTLEQIMKIFKLAKEKRIEINYFQINSTNNLDILLESETVVYLSLREDIDKQFFKLEQIYLEKKDELENINYIDVRYGDRAFINYK
jgi:cell division septal protein FtsQ